MNEDSLTHYGVLGMKWGRRKQKVSKGSNTKKSSKSKQSLKKTSNIKKKIKNITSKVDKEKVKNVAKTAAKVAGTVAVTSLLGYTGSVAMNEIHRLKSENAQLYFDKQRSVGESWDYYNRWIDQLGKTSDAKSKASSEKWRADKLDEIARTGNILWNKESRTDRANLIDFIAKGSPVINEELKLKKR